MKKMILLLLIFFSNVGFNQSAGTGFNLRNPGIDLTNEEINGIAVNYAGTTNPIDLDGDGNFEFIIRAENSVDSDCQIRIYEKTADNTFIERGTGIKIAVTLRLVTQIRSIFVANVDGDAEKEIVTITENSNTPDSRVNIIDVSTDGNFTMTEHTNSPIINPDDDDWSGLDYIGDLDSDGNPEFIVADVGSATSMVVYEWNGAGWTSRATGQPTGGVNKLAVGNLDADSDLEIAVMNDNTGSAHLEIWQISQSGGTFTLASDGTVNNNISYNAVSKANCHVMLFDLDKDGDLEIICVSNDNNGSVAGTTRALYVFERTSGTTYDRDITTAEGLVSNSNHFVAVTCGNMDADDGGEIYYSIDGSTSVVFREHDGTDNDFSDSKFSTAANLVTSMGTNAEAGCLGYFGGGSLQFDGDDYRDLMVGTLTTVTNDLYFLESTTIDGSLPVELTYFSIKQISDAALINWQTATEVNSYGFEIERSIVNVGQSTWDKIGFVAGHGNSNSVKEYSFTDKDLTAGQYQYRLKMLDNDGTFKYSSVVSVDITTPTEFELSQNYPNPFNPVTTIKYALPVDANVQLYIFSITGELVRTLVNEQQTAGSYSVNFDATGFASGTYVYRLVANDFVQTKKMILLK